MGPSLTIFFVLRTIHIFVLHFLPQILMSKAICDLALYMKSIRNKNKTIFYFDSIAKNTTTFWSARGVFRTLPCQPSKMILLTEIVSGFNYVRKKFHLCFFAGLWIRLCVFPCLSGEKSLLHLKWKYVLQLQNFEKEFTLY